MLPQRFLRDNLIKHQHQIGALFLVGIYRDLGHSSLLGEALQAVRAVRWIGVHQGHGGVADGRA